MGTRSVAYDLRELVRQLDRWAGGGLGLLQYWGFTYGIVLGMTFASLFPRNVGRMVLDGPVNTEHWYANREERVWQDADTNMDRYFAYCAEAGPARCALATTPTDSAEQIKRRVQDVLAKFKDYPIIVRRTATRGPDIITYDDVNRLIRLTFYEPIETLPLLATLLADLERGQGASFADYKADNADGTYRSTCLRESCRQDEACVDACRMLNDFKDEKAIAVMCVDINVDIPAMSRDEYYAKRVLPRIRSSYWAGDVTAYRGVCMLLLESEVTVCLYG
jgi:pimeloyl-ACP methyl ester carboxylesterase